MRRVLGPHLENMTSEASVVFLSSLLLEDALDFRSKAPGVRLAVKSV